MKYSLGDLKAVLSRQKKESANLKLGKWKLLSLKKKD